jgi:hypothetical protein
VDIVTAETRQAALENDRLQKLTQEERGRMLKAVCSAAARLHASRVQAGLPSAEPAPWPQSTWEFLRRHSPNARRDESTCRRQ